MDIQSESLKAKIAWARNAVGTAETAQTAIHCMDATSLSGSETKSDIETLTNNALTHQTASVCVYPQHVATASQIKSAHPQNGHNLHIATVINFPYGNKRTNSDEMATTETIAEDVSKAIANGATQIDIVFPYKEFLSEAVGAQKAEEFLNACRDASTGDTIMKVIVESAAYQNEDILRQACKIAVDSGTNSLKTSTGKHELGGATLEAAAILMDEANNAPNPVGVKISGGVKNNQDCAQYIALAKSIFGAESINPNKFRIGASANKILPDLLSAIQSPADQKNSADTAPEHGEPGY